jgi:hypothetical protein
MKHMHGFETSPPFGNLNKERFNETLVGAKI